MYLREQTGADPDHAALPKHVLVSGPPVLWNPGWHVYVIVSLYTVLPDLTVSAFVTLAGSPQSISVQNCILLMQQD